MNDMINNQIDTPSSLLFATVKWGGKLGDQEKCIFLSPLLFKKLGFTKNIKVTLKIGSLREYVTLCKLHSCDTHENSVLFVSPDLSEKCNLPVNHGLTLRFSKQSGLLAIGPLIGLLTTRIQKAENPFGTHEPVLMALVDSSADLYGFAFVFCPEDIDWSRSTVLGLVPTIPNHEGQREWHTLRLPLPDVIYDRIPSRGLETKPEIADAKNILINQLRLPYFNPYFLDKWETYQTLSSAPEMIPYLPPTKLVTGPPVIKEFLDLYNSVFIKPTSGSLGKKIIKIEKTNKKFKLLYRNRNKETVENLFPDFPALFRMIQPLLLKKPFVIQQDLHLAKYNEGPFDIRVLVQKDMRGNWRRTKIYTRVAAENSFLSNLSDGGRPVPIATVLKDVFDLDFTARTGLPEEIRVLSSKLPVALENTTQKTWGELGLDLGIDIHGKLWLIEINAKPFRALVSARGSTKVIQRSLMRPLEYAKYLAGFYKHSFK